MKPTRGLPNLWPGSLPQERRMALTATVLLFVLLGGMAVYQQITLRNQAAPESPGTVERPPGDGAAAPTGSAAESPTAAPLTDDPSVETAEPAQPATVQPPDRLTSPLDGEPSIVKAFGSLDQVYRDYRLYAAVAYAAKLEQPVTAAAKGKVVAMEQDPVEGTTLVLDHGGGMQSRYAGLGKVLVDLDAEVEAGETIAEVGQPTPLRAVLGSHLAFAVWVDGDAVDPAAYLKD